MGLGSSIGVGRRSLGEDPVTTYTQAEMDAYNAAQSDDRSAPIMVGGASVVQPSATSATGGLPKWLLILPLGLAAMMMFKGKGGKAAKTVKSKRRVIRRKRKAVRRTRRKSKHSVIWKSASRRRRFARFSR